MPRRPSLPTARLISDEPTAAQVRWVMALALIMLATVAVLVLIGNHIPKS